MKVLSLFISIFFVLILSGCENVTMKVAKNSNSPAFTISHVTAQEGDDLVFTVTLSSELSTVSTLNYQTMNGSALSGSHFTATSGVLTFLPGETSKTITVPSLANTSEFCASDKTFTLHITGSGFDVESATGRITDSEVPTISIADASATEGSPVNFVASLSGACASRNVSFNWTLSDGSVHAATITAGNLSTNLPVTTVDDATYEGTQNFTATLSSVTNATVLDGVATGTVLDNESIPVANFSTAAQTVAESGGTVSISVSLSHPSSQIISIPFMLSGSATGTGTDYTISTSPITINPGVTNGTILVSVVNDLLNELSETIIVTMGTPANALRGTTDIHTLTITDNDYARITNVTSTVANGTITTGTVPIQVVFSSNVTVSGTPLLNLNTTPPRFASYASGSGSGTLVFNYILQPGDTSADLDYLSTSALVLSGGTITDTLTSGNADLTLSVPGTTGSLGLNKNLVINAPVPPGVSSVTLPANGIYYEGDVLNFIFNFSESMTVTGSPVINMDIGGVGTSATYVSGSGSSNLVFRYTVASNISGNAPSLSSPILLSGGTIKTASNTDSTLTFTSPSTSGINVDGRAIELNFAYPGNDVSEASGIHRQFSVNLSAAPLVNLTIPLKRQGTAASGIDYDLPATTVVIPAGQTSATIDYDVLDDSVDESGKYFSLIADRPSSKSNLILGATYGTTVSILDDDPTKERWKALDVGSTIACGITYDDRLMCWGDAGSYIGDGTTLQRTIPVVVDSGVAYRSISTGNGHACGLTLLNEMKCWGSNSYGQLGDGTTTSRSTPVLADSGVTYKLVNVGVGVTCGITTSDVLKCWGWNSSGQVGNGTTTNQTTPLVIDAGVSYKDVSSNQTFTCAVTTTGVLKCWGINTSGQVGDGSTTTRTSPVIIDAGVSYKSVSTGNAHACGITTSDVLKCWGNNTYGRLGDGTTTNSLVPIVIDSGVSYKTMATASFTTCGITSGNLLNCWGNGAQGLIGDGTTTAKSLPVRVLPGTTFKSVASGSFKTCALTSSDLLKCWGAFGPLASLSTGNPKPLPVAVDSGTDYKFLSGGVGSHFCAITNFNELKCWGTNSSNQLGDGTVYPRSTPVTVDPGVTYLTVANGSSHTCGITTGNILKCWGSNTNGNLGDGTTTTRTTPTIIDPGVSYKALAAGTFFTCGITTSDVLKCWGQNLDGQIGIGSTTVQLSPVVVDSGVSYKSVTAGSFHTCAITTSNVLKCWGNSASSEVGDGGTTDRLTPVIIDAGTNYLMVTSSGSGNCGLTTGNLIKCWGSNSYGQIGDGSTTTRSTPVAVDSGVSYKLVSAGSGVNCGITQADELKCWGVNSDGQVGDGTLVNKTIPTLIDSGVTYQFARGAQFRTCAITTGNKIKCWGSDVNLGDYFKLLVPNTFGNY